MTMLLAHSVHATLSTIAGPVVASIAGKHDMPGQALIWLLVAAVVIGVVVGGAVLATRSAHRRRTNSHPGLFSGLCQHHKLDRTRRNLLKAIGQAHRVRYAARVFLDPSLFDPNHLPPGLRSRKDEILALRQQLFLVGDAAPPLQNKG